MDIVTLKSDYSGARLHIAREDNGDISVRIRGYGDMRISPSGGHLSSDDTAAVFSAFDTIITALEPPTISRHWIDNPERGRYSLFLGSVNPVAIIDETIGDSGNNKYIYSYYISGQQYSGSITNASDISQAKVIVERKLHSDIRNTLFRESLSIDTLRRQLSALH